LQKNIYLNIIKNITVYTIKIPMNRKKLITIKVVIILGLTVYLTPSTFAKKTKDEINKQRQNITKQIQNKTENRINVKDKVKIINADIQKLKERLKITKNKKIKQALQKKIKKLIAQKKTLNQKRKKITAQIKSQKIKEIGKDKNNEKYNENKKGNEKGKRKNKKDVKMKKWKAYSIQTTYENTTDEIIEETLIDNVIPVKNIAPQSEWTIEYNVILYK